MLRQSSLGIVALCFLLDFLIKYAFILNSFAIVANY